MLAIDKENYGNAVLKAKGVVVVDHYADWCGPCKALAPVFERMAERFKSKAVFAKLDVDKNPDLAAENGVMGIPTIIAFKDGKEIERMVGLQHEALFAQKIEAWLKA